MLVAVLGSATFLGLDALMLRLLLDDVVAAVPLHLGCGLVGTLFVGLFAREGYVNDFYAPNPAGGPKAAAAARCVSCKGSRIFQYLNVSIACEQAVFKLAAQEHSSQG
jgi:ammonia channel protein AmtB